MGGEDGRDDVVEEEEWDVQGAVRSKHDGHGAGE